MSQASDAAETAASAAGPFLDATVLSWLVPDFAIIEPTVSPQGRSLIMSEITDRGRYRIRERGSRITDPLEATVFSGIMPDYIVNLNSKEVLRGAPLSKCVS